MSPARDDTADSLLQQLEQSLQEIRDLNAEAFDPARFRYLEAMTGRAGSLRSEVAVQVATKTLAAIAQYRMDMDAQRAQAGPIAAAIISRFPDAAETAQELLRDWKFRGLQQLQARLQRGAPGSQLSILAGVLRQGEQDHTSRTTDSNFEDVLRQQERLLLANIAEEVPGERQRTGMANADPGELKSTRRLRESLVTRNADKLVTRALQEAPENPGPLNPRMLAIRSLSAMRELSPHYLTRFVSYTETLLWLEQAGIAAASGTADKPPAARPRAARSRRKR